MANTYGKKKAVTTSAAHRDLFGTDENSIEAGLANLNLEIRKSSQAEKPEIETQIRRGPRLEAVSKTPISKKQTVCLDDEDATEIKQLFTLADNKNVKTFKEFGDKLASLCEIQKIGEGSFAEVFRLTSKPTSSAQGSQATEVIMKVIPIRTPTAITAPKAPVSDADAVAREIKVLRTLDSVHGFTRFRGLRIVVGSWPKEFMKAFDAFKRSCPNQAQNMLPGIAYGQKQLYAIVEMDNAGAEVGLLQAPSVFQVYDIFWKTAIILAHAEEDVQFEHRDLHLSNICIISDKSTPAHRPSRTSDSVYPDIDTTTLKEMTHTTIPTLKLGLSNSKITIIDYTVTRCVLNRSTSSVKSTAKINEIAYDNMTFISEMAVHEHAPIEENLQAETYFKTRAAVAHAQRKTGASGDKWRQFVPRTNVVWLAYLLKSLSWRAKGGRARRYAYAKGGSKVARALQKEMWDTLTVVEDVVAGVDPEEEESDQAEVEVEGEGEFSDGELERTPESAGALVTMAVEKGWLSRAEIEAFKRSLEDDA